MSYDVLVMAPAGMLPRFGLPSWVLKLLWLKKKTSAVFV